MVGALAANFCVRHESQGQQSGQPLIYAVDFAFVTEVPTTDRHDTPGFLGTPGAIALLMFAGCQSCSVHYLTTDTTLLCGQTMPAAVHFVKE